MKRDDEEDEEDLGFLIVKGKDGQKQLFVDLGKVKSLRFYGLSAAESVFLTEIACTTQVCTPKTETSACTSRPSSGRTSPSP